MADWPITFECRQNMKWFYVVYFYLQSSFSFLFIYLFGDSWLLYANIRIGRAIFGVSREVVFVEYKLGLSALMH